MKLSIKNAIYAGTATALASLPAIASAQTGNPFQRGANAVAKVKRSEFNMAKNVPYVSDEVTLAISVEAIKQ